MTNTERLSDDQILADTTLDELQQKMQLSHRVAVEEKIAAVQRTLGLDRVNAIVFLLETPRRGESASQ